MIILDCEQGSDLWFKNKIGVPSASRYKEIVTSAGEPSKSRLGYMYELATQRITGVFKEGFKSQAMQDGNDKEALSRWRYAMENEVIVDQVGFCTSDCGRWGCSPDGLIGDDGLLELKNPEGKMQLKRLETNPTLVSMGYFQQVQGQLFVMERNWNDFVSCHTGLQLYTIRSEPDHEFLLKLESRLVEFCDELDALCKKWGTSGLTNDAR